MSFFFGDGLKYLGVIQHNASKFSNGLEKLIRVQMWQNANRVYGVNYIILAIFLLFEIFQSKKGKIINASTSPNPQEEKERGRPLS